MLLITQGGLVAQPFDHPGYTGLESTKRILLFLFCFSFEEMFQGVSHYACVWFCFRFDTVWSVCIELFVS